MPMINPVVHAQITATLGEFGEFEEVTGAELNRVLTEYYEAGRFSPRMIPGTHSYTPLVLTRAYDPLRDAPLIDWVNGVVLGFRADRRRNCVKTITNAIGIPIDQINYPNCTPQHIKLPDGRAGDSSIAQIVLTLAVEAQR